MKKQQMTLPGGIELNVDAEMLKCKKFERGAKYNKAHPTIQLVKNRMYTIRT
jgi:hypothetical protein